MSAWVLITGGSRGIGAAAALLCARAGWDVAINFSQDSVAAEVLAGRLHALGRRVLTLQADVADEAQVAAMFERLDAAGGRLGGLVNNAGIVAPVARLEVMDMARWQRLFNVNVMGTLLCCQQAARRMSTRHGGSGGAIVKSGSGTLVLSGANSHTGATTIDAGTQQLAAEFARNVFSMFSSLVSASFTGAFLSALASARNEAPEPATRDAHRFSLTLIRLDF